MSRILVADDEANIRKVLAALLRRDGHDVETVADGAEALSVLDAESTGMDVVISDLRMPKLDGLSLLREVAAKHPEIPVIVITAHGTIDTAVEAMKAGAFDYLQKPFEQEELRLIVDKAVRTRELARRDLRRQHGPDDSRSFGDTLSLIAGSSPSMHEVVEIIRRVASTPSTVLIMGESGTGKELVATALHEGGMRNERPFIKINCAAIPSTLMEAELFGHEKGAFTGAVASKPGRFELADGGTLFLDEIGEIPTEMQVKLLRALQESEFERVGGVKTIGVDVRLIAATNKNLEKEVSEGRFREDLYYRLAVVPLRLPPLRERRADIPSLVEHFLDKYNRRLDRRVSVVEPEAMAMLQAYSWPGNIRELENVMERTLLFTDGETIGPDDLPEPVRDRTSSLPRASIGDTDACEPGANGETSMKDIVRQAAQALERDLISRALESTSGNVTRAAQRLRISRKSLQLKMKELGLRDE